MMNRFCWMSILYEMKILGRNGKGRIRSCIKCGVIRFAEFLLFRAEERAAVIRPLGTPVETDDSGAGGRREEDFVLSGYNGNMTPCSVRQKEEDVLAGVSMRMDSFVRDKKIFLDPDLTLERLAGEIGSNRTYLSRALARYKGVHFNRYINSFRLRHAAGLLEDGAAGEDMLDMALLSGFKNTRTFRRALEESSGDELLYLKKRYICK